ncbi:MAG: glycosyltransferase family A protein, partial [Patescibacteria group bacterium]
MKSVSVVIPTFNSIRTIEACLSSLRQQNYDQDRIEILIADGGSTDGTIDVIKRHQGKIIRENSGNPETAKAIALEQAGGELVLLMASDNILPNRQWLKTMVNFLVKEPKALA